MDIEKIKEAAKILVNSKHTTVFTGAGISVESGIPPFRGPDGLWSKYDPTFLEIHYFNNHPAESWKLIKEIFYDFMGKAKPNPAHYAVAELEHLGIVKAVITQNIDNLHQEAGSKVVYEFHGTTKYLTCMKCGKKWEYTPELLEELPPRCPECGGILKPDFVFFGEPIPEPANSLSFNETRKADIFLVIGTTGEIYPASLIPQMAKTKGAKIIEVNVSPSNYTNTITDIFLEGKAGEIMPQLIEEVKKLL